MWGSCWFPFKPSSKQQTNLLCQAGGVASWGDAADGGDSRRVKEQLRSLAVPAVAPFCICLSPPARCFLVGRVPVLKSTTEKRYPYSNLSTGGSSCFVVPVFIGRVPYFMHTAGKRESLGSKDTSDKLNRPALLLPPFSNLEPWSHGATGSMAVTAARSQGSCKAFSRFKQMVGPSLRFWDLGLWSHGVMETLGETAGKCKSS